MFFYSLRRRVRYNRKGKGAAWSYAWKGKRCLALCMDGKEVLGPMRGREKEPLGSMEVNRMAKYNVAEQIKRVLMVLLGNAIYAVAVTAFIVPNGLITGGSTGLALFFDYQFHVPIAVFVLCFNGIMFVLGAFVLGKSFALTTLISTFCYPMFLALVEKLPQISKLTDNPLLAAVYGGGLIGLAIGLVLRQGASTGGMDIPPLILNRIFGLSIPVMLYVFDSFILLLQMFISNSEQVLYGILVVLIYTIVLDKALLAGKSQMQVKIVSEKYEAMNQVIQNTMDRGSTLIRSVTGHMQKEQMMVLAVVSNREMPRLVRLAGEIDPQAFIIINQVSEVRGRGFTLKKKYDNAGERKPAGERTEAD